MGKSAVRVLVRTRPTTNFAQDQLLVDTGSGQVTVDLRRRQAGGILQNQTDVFGFKFDKVMHNASQETVYEESCRDIVASVLDGFNGTLMCYGQTGAGKTFTMTGGGAANYKYRGVIPRAISHIFSEVAAHPETAFSIRVSYLEIYNDALFDLLSPENDASLAIQEDLTGNGGVNVKGLSQIAVSSEEDALSLLFEGETNRTISEHAMNRQSSRSHCIFTVFVESKSRMDSTGKTSFSKLNLVDLAGSERVGRTQSEGQTLKEANYINRSLSFLEQTVIALSTPSRDHVPYRQTKLTNVLRDSLGGNCRTSLVANIWAEATYLDETISTLKFATRMMRVQNDAVKNVVVDTAAQLKQCEKEVAALKQELAMVHQLANRTSVSYEPISEDERRHLEVVVRSYMDGDLSLDAIELDSVRKIREMFAIFRDIAANALKKASSSAPSTATLASAAVAGTSSTAASAGVAGSAKQTTSPQAAGGQKTVGELDKSGSSSGAGIAPVAAPEFASKTARTAPSASSAQAHQQPSTSRGDVQSLSMDAEDGDDDGDAMASGDRGGPPAKNEAFETFKRGAGASLAANVRDGTVAIRDKKKLLKDLSTTVNACKREIDRLSADIEARRSQASASGMDAGNSGSDDVILDEEEFAMFRDLKDQKRLYKDAFAQIKSLRAEVEYLTHSADSAKQSLVLQFEAWYEKNFGNLAPTSEGQTGGRMSATALMKAGGPSKKKTGAADDVQMDDAEKFEQMEMERILSEDPDAAAFYRAKKQVRVNERAHEIKKSLGSTGSMKR